MIVGLAHIAMLSILAIVIHRSGKYLSLSNLLIILFLGGALVTASQDELPPARYIDLALGIVATFHFVFGMIRRISRKPPP
jgi:hypothetical protein